MSSVVPDSEDEAGRLKLFGTPKNNLGRDDLPSLTFTIETGAVLRGRLCVVVVINATQ